MDLIQLECLYFSNSVYVSSFIIFSCWTSQLQECKEEFKYQLRKAGLRIRIKTIRIKDFANSNPDLS